MKESAKQTLAKIGMALCALSWGVSVVVVKDTLNEVQPNWMVAIRYFLAALLVVCVGGKKLLRMKWQEVFYGSVVGVLAYFGMFFQTGGLQYTTPGKSAFLTASYCVIVPFIAWAWTRKRPTWQHFVAGALCLAGIGFIALENDFSINRGDLLSLCCAVEFALNFVMIDRWFGKLDLICVSFVQIISTAIVALLAAFLVGESLPVISVSSVGSLLYLALIATGLSMLAQNIIQRHIDSSTASLLSSLESVFAVISSILFMNEQLTLRLVIGFVLVFSAVLLAEIDFKTIGKKQELQDERV